MKRVRLNNRVGKAFRGSSRGFTLIEVVIAIALIGIIGVAVLGSLSYASTILIVADRQATAESLARSQMESVKNQPYDFDDPQSYEQADVESTDYPGYFISVSAEPLHNPDDGLQQITVTVSYDILRYNITTQKSTLVRQNFTLVDYKRQPVT